MPRHDWFDDDTTSRDRSDMRERGQSDYGRRERSSGGYEDRDRGAFFDRDRERNERDRDRDERGRNQPIGGWGGLMGEDRDRDSRTERDWDRERIRDRDRDRDSFRGEDRDRDRFRGEDRDRSRGEDRRYGPDDHNRGIAMDETKDLIASNKVEGTPVYDRHGDKLGSIHNFMVHKTKGHIVYAVLKHGGGFLGLNERYYPLEWNQLDYDTRLGGYHTRLDEEDLKSFGSFDSEGRWHRRSTGERSDRDRDSRRERSSRDSW